MINTGSFGSAPQEQIIHIIMRSLGYIDKRLIQHGERVAYIAEMIARMDAELDIDREKLFILCLLHDIGAYKTEEIDNMVRFETDDVMNHAIYGYAFLRNTTDLGDAAEAILYHHTNYDKLAPLDTPNKTMAALISLADRIDILLSVSGSGSWEPLRKLSGTVFSPALIKLFFAAEEKFDISGHIRDLTYKNSVDPLIKAVSLSEADAINYLKMLVYSIDFRSPFTVTHTASTTAISKMLAELFGLDEETRYAIAQGAFLHDIGKIAIPYSILENPGRLTMEQMRTMKMHVAYSEDILQGIVPDRICQIAVRHHEKLNGTGYCHGLRAADLTLPERIVAVSDILSALLGRRSYKTPFSKEKSLSILTRMCDAGELCPQVCLMASENFDDIARIVELADNPVMELYETIRKQYEALISRA